MFRFENPGYLYLLIILPLLLILFFYALNLRKKNLEKFGNPKLLKFFMPEASLARIWVKFWLAFVAAAFLIIVIAGPQFGSKRENVKREGVEIMIALDVSNSMLSQDKDLSAARLEKAKQLVSKIIDNLKNDKVGLVVFAGDAYIQMPITTDFMSAKMFLSSINPNIVPIQGTAIGKAIALSERSFTSDEGAGKAIIVITDGENHEDDAVAAATHAAENNILVHVVGIGSLEGSPIPIGNTNNFRKDKDGNIIVSKLNEAMCRQIAHAGKGIYARADNSNSALKALQDEINKMGKSEMDSVVYTEYNEQFPIFAWFALLLLLGEFFVMERKNRLFRKVKLFESGEYNN
ncbi:MAG: VWA domain-containing protein [Candidatus Azobacteroides sp.]|nr:VWA domain-containing protein [Candidatus Azobacteroides sp.]